MPKDPFVEGFNLGEAYAISSVESIFKGIEVKYSKTYPKKEAQQLALQEFSGFFAGMNSTTLFRAHQLIEKMLAATGAKPNEADLWAQKVFTLFVQALQKEKVPVECKFIISRAKKGE